MDTSRFNKFCLLIIIGTIVNPSFGFNYTEFFLKRNPYLARKLIEGFEGFSVAVSSALGLPVSSYFICHVVLARHKLVTLFP